MKFKLAIDDLVGVQVKGKCFGQDGKERAFSFILVCDRLSEQEMSQVLADKQQTFGQFFNVHARGWQGQDLVVGEDGNPAPYDTDALEALMSVRGMSQLCFASYLEQARAIAKN